MHAQAHTETCKRVENTHDGTCARSGESGPARQVRMALGKSKVSLRRGQASSFLDFYYV